MPDVPVIAPKKLIEVALPLDAINAAAAREKSIRHGHPSTLHLWWARRPLAAARAVIFAQLVNDPEDLWRVKNPGKEPSPQQKGGFTQARTHLFKIIEELVKWENTTNENVLEKARKEIRDSWKEVCALNKYHPQAKELFNPDKMPGLHDPFAGGGTIPLEAQRLGLEAFASDLNPVAVLINKAMIEIPPKFAGRPPVNPASRKEVEGGLRVWKGAEGLAEDVRYYGAWMRDEAKKRIGHLYPPVEVTAEMAADRPDLKPYVGQKLTVIAWLWARTVKSPNPAFAHVDVPLVSTFILGSKEGKEAYVQPVIDGDSYRFEVRVGQASAETKDGTKAARGNFRCLLSKAVIDSSYIRSEAQAGRMGTKLMALVAEGTRSRVYLSPTEAHSNTALSARPSWKPELKVTTPCHDVDRLPMYGMWTWGDAFTPRQLMILTTLCDLISDVGLQVQADAASTGSASDELGSWTENHGTLRRADAVCVYLAFAVSRMANYSSSLCVWSSHPKDELAKQVFLRQALAMTWDFAETNPFASAGGGLSVNLVYLTKALENLTSSVEGVAHQDDATKISLGNRFVATDPPYFDNISYAELSDFFYVWLRRSLRTLFPQLLSTINAPKSDELVAAQHRHVTKARAEQFFLNGMSSVMTNFAHHAHPGAPTTLFYAFKQSDTDSGNSTSSTGWETFLEATLKAGLSITGTWPMRTELVANLKKSINALASSIILVCRPRAKDAPTTSRRKFISELNAALPLALDAMTRQSEDLPSPVAPVDLSQAIIGPGMAIFSKYTAVLEADGKPMTVRTALQLINRFLAEDDFDADTQFCLHWFEQHGWDAGPFGEADTLARAKGTAVNGVAEAGVIASGGGSVRLLKWCEYPDDWNPETDDRLPVWELLHHTIRLQKLSEQDAGRALAACMGKAEAARQLAYRLYTLCERSKRAEDARAYNEVVTGWSAIESAATAAPARPKNRNVTPDIPFEE